jgi:hypothetical protein
MGMTKQDSEPEPLDAALGPGPASAEAGSAAIAMALARGRSAVGSDAKLDAFLDEQTRFLRLQSENLHEQRQLQIDHLKQQEKHFRLRYFGDRLRIGLQLLGIAFAEADGHAPRWGRNHLRWGEALLRSGRCPEARAQFEAAKGMDLSRADRAGLDVFLARTASGRLHG